MKHEIISFDPNKSMGNYIICAENIPLKYMVDTLKEEAERFIPEKYRKQIKYWKIAGYSTEETIIPRKLTKKELKMHENEKIIPVWIYNWKYRGKDGR